MKFYIIIMLIILLLLFILFSLYIIINNTITKSDESDTETNEIVHSNEHTNEHTNIPDGEHFTDIIPLYFDKPSKLFNLYFPYIDINYMNSKLKCVTGDSKMVFESLRTNRAPEHLLAKPKDGGSHKYTSIDNIIQSIDGYEYKIYDIIINKQYEKIFNGVFIIKPEYKILYNIFYAYMLNRKNSQLVNENDVKNKYIIKRLFNDTNYLYIVPYTEVIENVNNIPEISNYNMIDTMCKKDNKYIQCKIKVIPPPTNFQKIDDMYYNYIVRYLTIIIFIDIMKLAQAPEQCSLIIKQEQENADKIKNILGVRVPILF